ncbi:MAG: hypothetical protein WCD60_27930, partial [Pseudolabrys sp.]
MKSRRLTAAIEVEKGHRTDSDYLIERGVRVSPEMSALGQKQTCAAQLGMSALPQKADIHFTPAFADRRPLHRPRAGWQ